MAIQRFIKRRVEADVFAPLLREAGYQPTEAGVRLNWGQPEGPDFVSADVIEACKAGIITPEEARKILAKSGRWEI